MSQVWYEVTKAMKVMEYLVKIGHFPTKDDGYENGVIEVLRDVNGVDVSLRFLCPCGQTKIYIPLGDDSNEPGNDLREIVWIEKDKVISISPSIEVRGGCKEHFYIVNNKVK